MRNCDNPASLRPRGHLGPAPEMDRKMAGRTGLGLVVSAALAMAAGLSCSAPAAAQTSLAGTWSGQVTQLGRDGSYAVVLTINAKGASTDYPDEPCRGALKRVGASPNYTFYTEEIVD